MRQLTRQLHSTHCIVRTESDSKVREFQSKGRLGELPNSSLKEWSSTRFQVLTLLLGLSHCSLASASVTSLRLLSLGLNMIPLPSAVVPFESLCILSAFSLYLLFL